MQHKMRNWLVWVVVSAWGASALAQGDTHAPEDAARATVSEPPAPAAASPSVSEPPAPAAASPSASESPPAASTQAAEPPPAVTAAPVAVEKPGDLEEIVVTGTRIGRSNLEEFAHITVVTADELKMSGVATVDELLYDMPSVTLQGLNRQKNNDGWGLAFVDLRNLGVERTLVLVNGKRFIKSGGLGEVNYTGVDLNNIPVQMIERVEVLLDGASAAYGSDAIGGVINVILKDNFEGLALDASAGISQEGDGAQFTMSGTFGANSDNGNVTVNLSYVRRNEVPQKDREWAAEPVTAESFNDDGSVTQLIGSGTHPASRAFVGDDIDVVFLLDPASGRSFTDWSNDLHRYNYGTEQWLMGKMQRFSTTLLGSYDFTENAKLYAEGTHTNRTSRNRLAPQPVGGGTAVFPGFLNVPITNPYIPDDFRAILPPGTESISLLRRMAQVGNRIYANDSNTFRFVVGSKGAFSDDLGWDVYIDYGQNSNLAVLKNSVNLARVNDTVDPALCAANAARGCVVGNYFGDDTLSEEVLNYIRQTEKVNTYWDMLVAGGELSGDLIDLPGGRLGLAFGAEARRESGRSTPDAAVIYGESSGNLQDATSGDYNAQEVFGEVSLPLFKDLPGVSGLTLDLAARYSHYSTFGDGLTYRAGLSWAPIEDLRMRGVYSTAFRAPSIVNLYSGATDSYEAVSDPCNDWANNDDANVRANCAAQGVPDNFNQADYGGSQIRTNVGGNPDLDSETATTLNAGLVFSPSLVKGLSFTADFYRVIVDGAIDALEPQYIMDSCYQSEDLSHPNCRFIEGRGVNSMVTGLVATLLNLNKIETMGLDFTANYGFPLAAVGVPGGMRLDVGFHANYLFQYDQTVNQEFGETVERAGTISYYNGTFTHLRWLARLSVSGDNWSVNNMVRFIGGADVFGADSEVDPTASLPAVAYWDLAVSYYWRELTLVLGVDNVLNMDPPFLPEGGQNANLQTYDFIGRYVFLIAGYRF